MRWRCPWAATRVWRWGERWRKRGRAWRRRRTPLPAPPGRRSRGPFLPVPGDRASAEPPADSAHPVPAVRAQGHGAAQAGRLSQPSILPRAPRTVLLVPPAFCCRASAGLLTLAGRRTTAEPRPGRRTTLTFPLFPPPRGAAPAQTLAGSRSRRPACEAPPEAARRPRAAARCDSSASFQLAGGSSALHSRLITGGPRFEPWRATRSRLVKAKEVLTRLRLLHSPPLRLS